MTRYAAAFCMAVLLAAGGFPGRSPRHAGKPAQSPHPTIISVVVSASPPEHMLETLRELAWLREHRRIAIGDVLLSGIGDFSAVARLSHALTLPRPPAGAVSLLGGRFSELQRLMRTSDLKSDQPVSLPDTLKRIEVRYSPTWVIRHRGRDYVFEGVEHLRRYLTADGELVLP